MTLDQFMKMLEELRVEHGGDVECVSFGKSGSTALSEPCFLGCEDGVGRVWVGPEMWL